MLACRLAHSPADQQRIDLGWRSGHSRWVLSVFGGWGVTRDPQYMYVQSTSHQDISDRTRQGLKDSLRSYNFAIVATAAGLLCLAIGALIGTFFA
jgi:hypothetical protein